MKNVFCEVVENECVLCIFVIETAAAAAAAAAEYCSPVLH